MKELLVLLDRLWVVKEQDRELYHSVKDAVPKFKVFLEEKLGYKLVINPYMVKLEKLPGKAEEWMGIMQFESEMEYALLCLLLVFLEDKGAGDQFILSELVDFVQGAYPADEKPDWTLFSHRRAMVRVLRYASENSLMKVDDGDDSGFMDSVEAEVLYESTGLSKYFVRNFTGNIINYSSWKDIESGEWFDIDRDRGRIRRNRVYRRLVMSPAVYQEGADDSDYEYIKNFRGLMGKEFEDMLGSTLHVHKNGAFMVFDRDRHLKHLFPENKGISDIVLQINYLVVEKVEKGELKRGVNDVITISRARFDMLVDECRKQNLVGWGKEYREMASDKLSEEAAAYMKSFGMLEIEPSLQEVRLMPLIGKITGRYPKDFANKTEDSEDA